MNSLRPAISNWLNLPVAKLKLNTFQTAFKHFIIMFLLIKHATPPESCPKWPSFINLDVFIIFYKIYNCRQTNPTPRDLIEINRKKHSEGIESINNSHQCLFIFVKTILVQQIRLRNLMNFLFTLKPWSNVGTENRLDLLWGSNQSSCQFTQSDSVRSNGQPFKFQRS